MKARKTMRRLLVALGLVGAVIAVWTAPAPAQAPDAQGWWWVAGGTPVAPPGVPADGLYVASNPSGTQGVSALRFQLAGGGSAGSLRLDLAGAPSGTPVLGLCQVAAPWQPAQGGALSSAPACAQGGPTAAGQAAADGQSYTFDIGKLVSGGVLDVAVIPGKDPSGNNTTFSVSFKKPAADALTPAGAEPAPTGTDTGTAPTPEPSPAPSFSAQPSTYSPPPAFEPDAPDAPITGGGSESAGGNAAPVASPLAVPSNSNDSSNNGWRVAGFALLVLTAIAYHRLSITPDRVPRSLVTFGQLAGEDQA